MRIIIIVSLHLFLTTCISAYHIIWNVCKFPINSLRWMLMKDDTKSSSTRFCRFFTWWYIHALYSSFMTWMEHCLSETLLQGNALKLGVCKWISEDEIIKGHDTLQMDQYIFKLSISLNWVNLFLQIIIKTSALWNINFACATSLLQLSNIIFYCDPWEQILVFMSKRHIYCDLRRT